MKSRVLHYTYILVLFFSCACQPGRKETQAKTSSGTLKRLSYQRLEIKPEEIRKYIIEHCEQSKVQTPIAISIKLFYKKKETFLWLGKYMLAPQADSLLFRLENSSAHGLNPETFYLSNIKNGLKKISTLKLGKGDNINRILAEIEYKLTSAYLHYVCGLSFGFTDPHKIFNNMEDEEEKNGKPLKKLLNGKTPKKELYSIPLDSCDNDFTNKALNYAEKGDAVAFLDSVQPKNIFYVRLQKELERVKQLKEQAFPQIPNIGDTLLKIGDKHPIIPLVAQRLIITGELDKKADLSITDQILTQELINAINRFRKENLIATDNSLGNLTIKALNHPPSYYKSRLQVNMERLRWRPKQEKGDRYILINIAAAMLQAIDGKADTLMEMRVCVGSTKNKTPLLTSTFQYVEMNPYWNVPQSIIMKEIIPSYRKDTSYFSKNRFKVYDKEGHEINPHTVNWFNYEQGVPFDIKQDNKDGNSLGRMIFRFPNTHSVYLHDTPARYAFKLNNRAISHGCVRLENPLGFAYFLLDKQSEIIKDRIRLAIGLSALSEKGKKLKDKEGYKELENYTFRTYIPIFMEYYTNFISKDGQLSYCEDSYAFDPPLLKALEQLN